MKPLVCYIHVPGSAKSQSYLYRFFTTWKQHPPGCEAEVMIVCNGSPMEINNYVYLDEGWKTVTRSNEGWDLGAYIERAKLDKPELMVCLGESVYFHREGWLKRLVDAAELLGGGMYGMLTSNMVTPHINTTAFAITGGLLAACTEQIATKEQRYQFEHGPYPFWRRIQALGLPVRLVTFDGIYPPGEWRAPANILWKGDQSNCLVWCSHTDRYKNAPEDTRRRWEFGANMAYKS